MVWSMLCHALERLMTLCIAAICTHEKQPAIVLCADWRSETGDIAGGDVQDKLRWLVPTKIAALMAGSLPDAERLIGVLKATVDHLHEPLSIDSVRPILDTAMQRYRWMLIDHYLNTTLGIDYAALVGGMKISREPEAPCISYPDEFINEKLHAVEHVPIPNCQLILAGFIENQPMVAVVNEPTDGSTYARTRFDSNFAAIGSGSPAALISLYRREHTATDVPLMKAAYNVYEAKPWARCLRAWVMLRRLRFY